VADGFEETRRTVLRQQIEARLRDLCSHFPADEFDRLVEKIIDTQLRGEQRSATWGRDQVNPESPPLPPSTERDP
jgi:hypothetical protein